MKTLKKILPIIVIAAFFIPLSSWAAQAIEIPNPFGPGSTLWTVIGRVINFLFWAAMVAGIFCIIYAGYLFLFSAGDPEKVKTARRLIIYTVIGIIIVFLAKPFIALMGEVIGFGNPFCQTQEWNGIEQRMECK